MAVNYREHVRWLWSYQVETEQQRAERCNEEDVDKVACKAVEPRSWAHGAE
jgi:hypothetical protein